MYQVKQLLKEATAVMLQQTTTVNNTKSSDNMVLDKRLFSEVSIFYIYVFFFFWNMILPTIQHKQKNKNNVRTIVQARMKAKKLR